MKPLYTLCFLILTAFVVPAQQQHIGSLSGKVTDEREGLIVAAVVTVTAADGVQKSTVTNAQGLYSLTGLQAGKYVVRVSAKGFLLLKSRLK